MKVKAVTRTKELFEVTYANGIRVQVTNHGVTIWDSHAGRWVVDASCIFEDQEIRVADVTKDTPAKWRKRLQTFKALYPRPRKRKAVSK